MARKCVYASASSAEFADEQPSPSLAVLALVLIAANHGMVNTISDTFDVQFHTLKDKYKDVVSAEALFWKRFRGGTTYDYGMRMEVPTLMKEFVDNVNLGTDPEGFLFFNNIGDLDAGDGKYNVLYNTTGDVNQRAVRVQFFHHKQGSFYAEFLAKDPNKTVDYLIDGQVGKWATLETGSASAHIKKYSDESDISIKIPAIKKQVTFSVPDNNAHASIDVWGNFMFKDISRLQSSSDPSYADYNQDRIVFYRSSGWTGSADFTASSTDLHAPMFSIC
ncbi:uncharacterized protein FIBRA_04554 [Fibroporia radiculosa]|uniref:Uncharacterized protein n=1 Tax=Fibroporia radiculosa TaxID=599839 RepID=J4GPG0_9APHY|nr:uncharacterized protein FIBRA_04554 [Fibroporia radiculosa]CCM02455.1 predicted protein [Fibroporia radiculosa]